MERFLFVLFGVIGVALAGWAGTLLWLGLASNGWPVVQGQNVLAEAVESYGSVRPTDAPTSTAKAVVEYRYAVDGQEYTGDNISFGNFYSSSLGEHTYDYLMRYKAGRGVPVHYDPRDPARSVLEPGVSQSMGVLLGIGLLLALVGLGLPYAHGRRGSGAVSASRSG